MFFIVCGSLNSGLPFVQYKYTSIGNSHLGIVFLISTALFSWCIYWVDEANYIEIELDVGVRELVDFLKPRDFENRSKEYQKGYIKAISDSEDLLLYVLEDDEDFNTFLEDTDQFWNKVGVRGQENYD